MTCSVQGEGSAILWTLTGGLASLSCADGEHGEKIGRGPGGEGGEDVETLMHKWDLVLGLEGSQRSSGFKEKKQRQVVKQSVCLC